MRANTADTADLGIQHFLHPVAHTFLPTLGDNTFVSDQRRCF